MAEWVVCSASSQSAEWSSVRSTRPSYEYRAPLMYVEPIAELEAVDTPPKKNSASFEARHSNWALTI